MLVLSSVTVLPDIVTVVPLITIVLPFVNLGLATVPAIVGCEIIHEALPTSTHAFDLFL